MCHLQLLRNGKTPPTSILDLGSGTAFKLSYLHQAGYECMGVDYLEPMVSYSRNKYPGIRFEVGDIRNIRIGRQFDTILCLGWVLENVHSCEDIEKAMATFEAHAKPGTLLFLSLHNPIGGLEALGTESNFSIEFESFKATGEASFTVDRRHQILTRHLTWSLPGGVTEEEVSHHRLFFPMELEHYLTSHGFGGIEMYDSGDLDPTALADYELFVTATYRGVERSRKKECG